MEMLAKVVKYLQKYLFMKAMRKVGKKMSELTFSELWKLSSLA